MSRPTVKENTSLLLATVSALVDLIALYSMALVSLLDII